MSTKLEKMAAPAYWSRWAVVVNGQRIGTAEKKGMSSGWYAYDRDGKFRGGPMGTRAAAIRRVEESSALG